MANFHMAVLAAELASRPQQCWEQPTDEIVEYGGSNGEALPEV